MCSCAMLTCRTAGVDGEPLVFLFSDTQIVQEGFLEDINNMLNSGEKRGTLHQHRLQQRCRMHRMLITC